METQVSLKIIESYFEKLKSSLELDVAIVGAGPSGLVCAYELAKAGHKVAIFESKLAPGGGIWGGAMLFNELVIQEGALGVIDEMGIRHSEVVDGLVHADSVEVASGLVFNAVNKGAVLYNGVTVEDVVFKNDRVAGVVINWTPVLLQGLHVDPLVVTARCVLDASGHDARLTEKVARKAGVKLDTPTGAVMGERPMWAEAGEKATVENSGEIFPGLYVSGMASNGVRGSFRMGPIFGGMFLSGQKVAREMMEVLG